jgi:uncharacterized protein YdiU (UPF0061 family)
VLTRVAPSHLRFGNFEVFFYRQQYAELKILADFIIEQFYPACREAQNPYLELLRQVIDKTAALIARWQLVGFTHGVLNTDNMSMLGLTIDYGPYGFLDSYESGFVCNHTDQQGRYAYDQQPAVGLFNLSCLAQAMLPVIDDEDGQQAAAAAKQLLEAYQSIYQAYYQQGMAAKLGIHFEKGDEALFASLFEMMQGQVDFTNFFRGLCDFDESGKNDALRDMFIQREKFDHWGEDYSARLARESSARDHRRQGMLAINPKYVLRNYLVHQSIIQAEKGNYAEVETLLRLLQNPFDEQAEFESYADEPPEWAKILELSCSS